MKSRHLYLNILAIGILGFLGVLLETSLNVVFPDLMKEFNLSADTVQWLTTAYLIITAVITPLSAYIQTTVSFNRIFLIAWLFITSGLIIATFSTSFIMLLMSRFISAIGVGMAIPLMFTVVLENAPASKIGNLMGLATLTIAAAPALGPTYGGVISEIFNWRYIFIAPIPLLFISLLLGAKYVEKTLTIKAKFDIKGSILLLIVASSFILSFNMLYNNTIHAIVLFFVFLVALISFLNVQKLLNLRVFKYKSFLLAISSFFLMQLCSLMLSYLLPSLGQFGLSLTPLNSALTVLPGTILDAIIILVAGKLLDDFGEIIITRGLYLLIMGSIIFVFAPISSWSIIVGYVLFMSGLGFSYSTLMTVTLSHLPKKDQKDGNSLFNTAQAYSGAVGVAIAGTLLGFFQSKLTMQKGALLGSQLLFIFLLLLSILILFLTNYSFKKRQ